MFEFLSNKISKSIRSIMQVKHLTEKNIKKTLHEVRISLLEGDVALPVVYDFVNRVKKDVIGKNINKCLTPGQEFTKIIFAALVKTIGKGPIGLNLNTDIPIVILVVGPPGTGKTTTVGKLAKFLNKKKNKKVLVTSIDIYRPAGLHQLKTLVCFEKNIDFFSDYSATVINTPIDLVKKAVIVSKLQCYDILLIDTAGCLDTDYNLLAELTNIHKIIKPTETLFVIDSMVGQVAVNSVKAFDQALSLTGVILTKLDGDVRGGVALSITHTTDKPIKFIGTGEKINDLESFYPDRIASRILGMGDVISLIEDIEEQGNIQKQQKSIKKYNVEFNLYDFLNHIKQIRQMGGINKIISKLPNFGLDINDEKLTLYDEELLHIEAMINSMTIEERMNPSIIGISRKKRIAVGSGIKVHDITKLLNKFNKTRVFVQQMNKNGIFKMFSTLQNKVSSKFSTR